MTKLKGVIFDLDGTVVDVPYDWPRIKEELEARGLPILVHLSQLKEPQKSEKWKILEKFEEEATRKAVLRKGMREFLHFLQKKGIKRALVTNNSRQNVDFLLQKFRLQFDCVISRESGLWKPSGAPFLAALGQMGVMREQCCVVGDSHFDVQAAAEAGIACVFILSGERRKFASMNAEVFSSIEALQDKIDDLLARAG